MMERETLTAKLAEIEDLLCTASAKIPTPMQPEELYVAYATLQEMREALEAKQGERA